ncbi:hypothetical protein [Streptomyces sp. NPDC102360]|uniref:hypothetical protein n=1 Tax=Streptomyces sp. NPDC102360 TaxID=3366160 RepID=UPI00382FF898
MQLSPHSVLDMIDVIHGVSTGRVEAPQMLDGNAYATEAHPETVIVQNEFVEHVNGEFTPRQVLDVLLDFWNYCELVMPGENAEGRARFVEEHGRDPLTAFG